MFNFFRSSAFLKLHRCHRLTHGRRTCSIFGHISVVCASIWTFFTVVLPPISEKEAISDGCKSENARYEF